MSALLKFYDDQADRIHAGAPLDYDDEAMAPGGNAAFAAYYARPDVVEALESIEAAREAHRLTLPTPEPHFCQSDACRGLSRCPREYRVCND